MDNYEIRIVKRDRAIAVHRSEHINDHAAIRRGHVLAEAGDQVEIWRGTQCVYAGQQVPAVAPSSFPIPHHGSTRASGNNV